MKCPACLFNLVPGRMQRAETMEEHVTCANGTISEKPTVVCPNTNCEAHNDRVFWLAEPEGFGEGPYGTTYKKDYDWYENNAGPYPSWQRQINVTILYKKNRKLLLTILGWKFYRRFMFDADEYGKILSRRRKLEIIEPGGVYWVNPLGMIIFSLKRFYMFRKGYLEDGNKWDANNLRAQYKDEQMKWRDCEWWRKVVNWYLNTAHGKLKQKLEG